MTMPNSTQNLSVQSAPATKPQARKPASKPGLRTPGTRQPQKPQLGAQQTKFAQALNAAQGTRRGTSASLAAIANRTGQAGLDAGLPGLSTGLPGLPGLGTDVNAGLGAGLNNGLGAGMPVAQQLATMQALAQRTSPVPPTAASVPPASPAAVRPTLDLPGNFGALVDQAAKKYGVEPALIAAVMKTESNFIPDAVSKAGAQGLMQLMPATARGLGVTDATNPLQAVMGGAKLLGQLLDKYNGNKELALAAYNAGSGAVDKFGGIPPYAETRKYVPLVLGAYEQFRQQANPSATPAAGR
jgi:soluble lytic murein transglycosylase-like protein